MAGKRTTIKENAHDPTVDRRPRCESKKKKNERKKSQTKPKSLLPRERCRFAEMSDEFGVFFSFFFSNLVFSTIHEKVFTRSARCCQFSYLAHVERGTLWLFNQVQNRIVDSSTWFTTRFRWNCRGQLAETLPAVFVVIQVIGIGSLSFSIWFRPRWRTERQLRWLRFFFLFFLFFFFGNRKEKKEQPNRRKKKTAKTRTPSERNKKRHKKWKKEKKKKKRKRRTPRRPYQVVNVGRAIRRFRRFRTPSAGFRRDESARGPIDFTARESHRPRPLFFSFFLNFFSFFCHFFFSFFFAIRPRNGGAKVKKKKTLVCFSFIVESQKMKILSVLFLFFEIFSEQQSTLTDQLKKTDRHVVVAPFFFLSIFLHLLFIHRRTPKKNEDSFRFFFKKKDSSEQQSITVTDTAAERPRFSFF